MNLIPYTCQACVLPPIHILCQGYHHFFKLKYISCRNSYFISTTVTEVAYRKYLFNNSDICLTLFLNSIHLFIYFGFGGHTQQCTKLTSGSAFRFSSKLTGSYRLGLSAYKASSLITVLSFWPLVVYFTYTQFLHMHDVLKHNNSAITSSIA